MTWTGRSVKKLKVFRLLVNFLRCLFWRAVVGWALGGFVFAIVLIPALVAILNEDLIANLLEVVLPAIFAGFVLINLTLLAISPLLLAVPYLVLVGAICYVIFVLKPSLHKVQKKKLARAHKKLFATNSMTPTMSWRQMMQSSYSSAGTQTQTPSRRKRESIIQSSLRRIFIVLEKLRTRVAMCVIFVSEPFFPATVGRKRAKMNSAKYGQTNSRSNAESRLNYAWKMMNTASMLQANTADLSINEDIAATSSMSREPSFSVVGSTTASFNQAQVLSPGTKSQTGNNHTKQTVVTDAKRLIRELNLPPQILQMLPSIQSELPMPTCDDEGLLDSAIYSHVFHVATSANSNRKSKQGVVETSKSDRLSNSISTHSNNSTQSDLPFAEDADAMHTRYGPNARRESVEDARRSVFKNSAKYRQVRDQDIPREKDLEASHVADDSHLPAPVHHPDSPKKLKLLIVNSETAFQHILNKLKYVCFEIGINDWPVLDDNSYDNTHALYDPTDPMHVGIFVTVQTLKLCVRDLWTEYYPGGLPLGAHEVDELNGCVFEWIEAHLIATPPLTVARALMQQVPYVQVDAGSLLAVSVDLFSEFFIGLLDVVSRLRGSEEFASLLAAAESASGVNNLQAHRSKPATQAASRTPFPSSSLPDLIPDIQRGPAQTQSTYRGVQVGSIARGRQYGLYGNAHSSTDTYNSGLYSNNADYWSQIQRQPQTPQSPVADLALMSTSLDSAQNSPMVKPSPAQANQSSSYNLRALLNNLQQTTATHESIYVGHARTLDAQEQQQRVQSERFEHIRIAKLIDVHRRRLRDRVHFDLDARRAKDDNDEDILEGHLTAADDAVTMNDGDELGVSISDVSMFRDPSRSRSASEASVDMSRLRSTSSSSSPERTPERSALFRSGDSSDLTFSADADVAADAKNDSVSDVMSDALFKLSCASTEILDEEMTPVICSQSYTASEGDADESERLVDGL
jgi:hypothetical protein